MVEHVDREGIWKVDLKLSKVLVDEREELIQALLDLLQNRIRCDWV